MATYTRVTVKLNDPNMFAVILRVAGAIGQEIGDQAARAWRERALGSETYDDVMALVRQTVHVA